MYELAGDYCIITHRIGSRNIGRPCWRWRRNYNCSFAYLFFRFSQKEAQGTSLGILLLPVGILGVLQFYKAGYVDMRTVWLVSFGFLVGSYFGSKIALSFFAGDGEKNICNTHDINSFKNALF